MGDFPSGFGRYQLVERLALGGMAELFIATSPGEHGFQKKVVIKRLLPALVHDETYNAMFIDEAKLTARLVHPKIAQTFELGKVDEALFIAMEYIDGIDVLALLREFAARRRRVEPALAAWIAHETLDALDYAHNLKNEDGDPLGIVHRDISPSNVLLSLRGDIKLVDFGIARAEDPERSHKSKVGTLKGKYGYMSPEQVSEQNLDARSDVFSVGVVLAELLTGRRLFAAANELDVLLMVRDAKLARFEKYGAELDAGLQDIVRKSLKKSIDERYQSAAAFRDALNEWLFQKRHRITPKVVSEVVAELRDAVVERRAQQSAPPRGDDIALGRVPSEDAAPMIIVEGGDSVPVIQMSYEPSSGDDGMTPPMHTVSIGELAAQAPPTSRTLTPSRRAETVVGRPASKPPTIPIPLPPSTPAAGTNAGKSATPQTASGSKVRQGKPAPRVSEYSGVVDQPIADTISAAVEQITLPEIQGRPANEDSQMRAFDDLRFDHLTEEPQARSRDINIKRPSQEEALSKPQPTPPTLGDITDEPDDGGEFHLTSPLRVMFRLMTARATGLLVVTVGGIKKEIYVRDGQPEYVSSNVASELFGNYLVAKGVLSEGELAMALAMMPHYGGKLGDTLVGLGLLKPLEVFRHLTRQVRSKIIDVCTWNKGGFGWYSGRENPREAFPLDFNAFEILGAGAMALSDDHIETWLGKHGSMKLRAVRTRRVGPERFEVKGLVQLCELLDGKRTIAELVETRPARADQLDAGRMLCLLEACDLARPS